MPYSTARHIIQRYATVPDILPLHSMTYSCDVYEHSKIFTFLTTFLSDPTHSNCTLAELQDEIRKHPQLLPHPDIVPSVSTIYRLLCEGGITWKKVSNYNLSFLSSCFNTC